jgi:hypothetical protein
MTSRPWLFVLVLSAAVCAVAAPAAERTLPSRDREGADADRDHEHGEGVCDA